MGGLLRPARAADLAVDGRAQSARAVNWIMREEALTRDINGEITYRCRILVTRR